MKVGTGVGMTIMPLVASALISTFEWRNSYLILGTVAMVAVIPVSQLMRRDPREMGLLPDGEKQSDGDSPVSVEEGLSLREAIRTRQLWMVCGFYLTIVFCGMTILTHIVLHAIGLEIPDSTAANIFIAIGGLTVVGRVTMGSISDKIGTGQLSSSALP